MNANAPTINCAVKIRCYPNREQRLLFAQSEGSARYVYNRMLRELSVDYRLCKAEIAVYPNSTRKPESVIAKARQVTIWKKQPETAFLAEVPSGVIGAAIQALDGAFKKFFKTPGFGYPKAKRRQGACSIQSPLDHRHKDKAAAWQRQEILFPGFGILKLAQPERVTPQQPKTLTMSRDSCGRYFVAFQVEAPATPLPANGKTIGVDLGVKTLATLSNGEKVEAHVAARKLSRRLKHAKRTLSRRQGARKGEVKSNRYRRQQQRVARLQCRIADARKDTQHKLTDRLTREYGVVCLEDLNVKGMTASAKGTAEVPGKNVAQKAGLNRGMLNAGFGEIRRQIEYKSHWRGGAVLFVDRFAPSSRTCSECGSYQKEFSLSIREWTCPDCGAVHDRDHNAAKNIVVFATAGNAESNGRGGLHPCGLTVATPEGLPQSHVKRQSGQPLNGKVKRAEPTRCRAVA